MKLDRDLYLQEVSEDGEEYGGEVVDDAWSGPSQDDWQNVVGFQQQVAPFLGELAQALQAEQQQQYQQQPQYQEPEFDPWDPDSVQSYISQNIQSGVEQALEPYSGILGIVASREGEQMATAELEKIRGEVGDFDTDTAFLVASGLIDQGHDPSLALRRAAEFSREVETRIREDERKKYISEIQNVSNSRGDVPVGGTPAEGQPPVPTGQDRYRVAVNRWLANRRPSMPIG